MKAGTGFLVRTKFTALLGVLLLFGFALTAGAAARAEDGASATPPTQQASAQPTEDASADYRLGSGDKLRVIVYGEEDLSGEFDVTGAGKVSLPLIGQVQAAGLTLDEFEKEVTNKLANGYLNHPKVSAEVLNYRPFYIIGEVTKPGQYPYTNGMTVLNAVAVAGGFTYRANNDSVFITRGDGKEEEFKTSQQVKVLPGDVVRVPERFF